MKKYIANRLTSNSAIIGFIILVLLFLHLHTLIFVSAVLLIVVNEEYINKEFRLWATSVLKAMGFKGGWQ